MAGRLHPRGRRAAHPRHLPRLLRQALSGLRASPGVALTPGELGSRAARNCERTRVQYVYPCHAGSRVMSDESVPTTISEQTPDPRDPAAKVRSFPATSGVYLMKDAGGNVIYVGKAKNLRARAASYFAKDAVNDIRI